MKEARSDSASFSKRRPRSPTVVAGIPKLAAMRRQPQPATLRARPRRSTGLCPYGQVYFLLGAEEADRADLSLVHVDQIGGRGLEQIRLALRILSLIDATFGFSVTKIDALSSGRPRLGSHMPAMVGVTTWKLLIPSPVAWLELASFFQRYRGCPL